jgi:hypothetical protein
MKSHHMFFNYHSLFAESSRISREHVGKLACLRAQSAAAAGVRPAWA